MKRMSRKTLKRGGMRLPLQYFGEPAMMSAGEGSDRMGVSGLVVRPKIGGKRSMRKRNTCKKGGFYPSVMGNFVPAASKYVTPLALFAAYKLMKQPTKKQGKGRRRHTRK
jgi:hypothetical protein